jgi:O-antigen/teichoic acid export membrane protein
MRLKHYHGGAIALFDQGVVSLTSFLSALIIGRVCGRADLGLYTLAWTLLSMSSELSGALITTPYTVFSPRLNHGRKRRYLGSMLAHQVVLTLLFSAAIAVTLVAGYAAGWISKATATLFGVSAAALVLVGLKEFVRRVGFAQLRVGSACATDCIASTLQLLGMFVIFRAGKLTVPNTLLLMGMSAGLAAGWWLWRYRLDFRFQSRLLYADLVRNWRFSRWVLGSGFLSATARYVFPWMLAAYRGSSAAGIWAACASLVAMCNPVVIGLSNYALPRISTVYAQEGRIQMRRKVNSFCALFALSLLPMVLALCVSGDRLVTRVYGPAFAGTSTILALLVWNMLVNSTINPYSQGLFTLNRAKEDTVINAVWVVLLFTAGVFAVRSYSVVGAAAALLVSSVVTAAARTIYFWNASEAGSTGARDPECTFDPRTKGDAPSGIAPDKSPRFTVPAVPETSSE